MNVTVISGRGRGREGCHLGVRPSMADCWSPQAPPGPGHGGHWVGEEASASALN